LSSERRNASIVPGVKEMTKARPAEGSPTPPMRGGIRFAVLIFPGFPLMAFSSVIEPLRAANVLSGKPCYSWITVGLHEDKVCSSSGVGIEPDHSVRNAPMVDRIVVCSGGDAEHVVAEDAVSWIRRNLRGGAHIGAVADAAFFLARAGLLQGHACTLHWTSQPAFREAFPDLDMKHDLYVIDRRRFTSAGGVGGLDMMLDMISTDYGADLAAGVAEWFVHSPLRSSVDRRMMPLRLRTGIRDELVLAAVAIMEDAVEERLSMAELARRLKISPDRLERAFQHELNVAPNAYYRNLRLRRAADLLTHSSLRIGEVALSCGFSNASSFSRSFREQFGYPPSEVRRRKSISGEAPRA
jgi:transcriptional regulator GlxA family with amidase domain